MPPPLLWRARAVTAAAALLIVLLCRRAAALPVYCEGLPMVTGAPISACAECMRGPADNSMRCYFCKHHTAPFWTLFGGKPTLTAVRKGWAAAGPRQLLLTPPLVLQRQCAGAGAAACSAGSAPAP